MYEKNKSEMGRVRSRHINGEKYNHIFLPADFIKL